MASALPAAKITSAALSPLAVAIFLLDSAILLCNSIIAVSAFCLAVILLLIDCANFGSDGVGRSRKAKKTRQEICKPSGMNWLEAVVENGGERNEGGLSVQIGGNLVMRVVNSHQAGLAVEMIRLLGVTRPC